MASRQDQDAGQQAANLIALAWTPYQSANFPMQTPTVTLIFRGLIAFCPDGSRCQVGIHSSGDSIHHHQLTISVYRKSDCNNVLEFSNLGKGDKIALDVDGADLIDGAYFFQPDRPGEDIDRKDLSDTKDFRWIMDFEGKDFYGAVVHAPKSGVYDPVFSVPNGLFYTLEVTESTFILQLSDGTKVTDLYRVAEYVGANIYLQPGGQVALTVNGTRHTFPLPGEAGMSYEIYFTNFCLDDATSAHCDPLPDAPKKEDRNDFYLHYKAIDLEGRPEYELVVKDNKGKGSPPSGLCFGHGEVHATANDNAPCAAAGYGGGGNNI